MALEIIITIIIGIFKNHFFLIIHCYLVYIILIIVFLLTRIGFFLKNNLLSA